MGKKYITKTLYKMHVQKICTKFTITVYLITIIIVNPLKMVLNFQKINRTASTDRSHKYANQIST